jgi:hypothetical protein
MCTHDPLSTQQMITMAGGSSFAKQLVLGIVASSSQEVAFNKSKSKKPFKTPLK